ncbi:MAG TPA: GNAT family N-acetyltransferase [Actinocrinis sp.]|jgi:ribosomal protein S18 acetylase RimI-like enzyme
MAIGDGVRIRHIAADDWDEIAALEAETYRDSGLSEGRAALESRAQASPATCFVLDLGTRIAGYVLTLPYPPYQYPDLHEPERGAFASRNLHLHDLVIGADRRGRGMARLLLDHLTAAVRAAGYEQISLVAVGGSDTFWSAQGYGALPEVALPESYGPKAIYMSRAI